MLQACYFWLLNKSGALKVSAHLSGFPMLLFYMNKENNLGGKKAKCKIKNNKITSYESFGWIYVIRSSHAAKVLSNEVTRADVESTLAFAHLL